MRTLGCLAATFLAVSSPVLAMSVDVYNCNLSGGKGFLSDQVMFIHDADAGEYLVLDGMINYVEGRPIVAEIKPSKDRWVKLSWDLLFTDSHGNPGRLYYGLSFDSQKSRVVVSMNAGTYENKEWARGACQKSIRNF